MAQDPEPWVKRETLTPEQLWPKTGQANKPPAGATGAPNDDQPAQPTAPANPDRD